ncbi:MAG: hypothetical protein C5B56_13180 [Proteobacteria bacterium]|nr:MAG: hypothetical protein C5B56_13180 [Pseudomonadota bacterium]
MTEEISRSAQDLQVELEKSRESAARLLETLAQKIGGTRAVRTAASSVQRAAHYVQAHSMKDVATEIDHAVRWRPAVSIAVAVVAGFLVGRAIRSRD